MNVGVVGLGLIGGSMAKTVKLHTDAHVIGCDISHETILQAKLLDAIDEEMTDENLATCDLVLVALYPGAIVDWITAHAPLFKEDSLIIDCGGVKQVIVNAVAPLARGAKWHYIGGHPMAGREFSGFRYARDDLFDNASMILTPAGDEDPALLHRARDFFMDLGFRRVQFATPYVHDELIAYTSQLAHIVSSAYVKTPQAGRHKGFSAGSFKDMTRVAKLAENMWTELFFDNRDCLLPELEGLVERMTAYRDALRDYDREAMCRLLREGREIKESLEEN